MFYKRRYWKISGYLCSNCHEKIFWNSFLTNLFLGWWGIISFTINPFLILLNIINYIGSWGIRTKSSYNKKPLADWKLVIPSLLIISIVYWLRFSPSDLQKNSVNTPQAPTSTVSSNILYSDNFSNSNSGWKINKSKHGDFDYYNGKYAINMHAGNFIDYALSPVSFSNGIIEVDVILPNDFSSETSGPIIFWRFQDIGNNYFLSITNEIFAIGKNDNFEISSLFSTKATNIDLNQTKNTIIIAANNNEFNIFVNNSFITSFSDSTFRSGFIGLGAYADSDKETQISFDNLIIYSPSEYINLIKKIPNSFEQSITNTPPSTSIGKAIITVINKSTYSLLIYCEGIYIFQIEPGKSNFFRFQKGTWRIDICSPNESPPCTNHQYIDMTNDNVQYTIY